MQTWITSVWLQPKSDKVSCNKPFWNFDLRNLECSKWSQNLIANSSTCVLHYLEEKNDFIQPSRRSTVSKLSPQGISPEPTKSRKWDHKKWKMWFSSSLTGLELPDCPHTLRTSSTHEFYEFREFQAIPMTLIIKKSIFGVGGQVIFEHIFRIFWQNR